MTEGVARLAAEEALGRPIDNVRQHSSGRSSDAWVATVGSDRWIVRVPIEHSGRRITYEAESAIGHYLGSRGHRVAIWTTVEAAGVSCSVARDLGGAPIEYEREWSDRFGQQLAGLLLDLHSMPNSGFGPLLNRSDGAFGVSADPRQGIVDRWFHAAVWPFDGSSLEQHPITTQAPRVGEAADALRADIEAAASGSLGVVHSDLHREHLLVGEDRSLAGVLDFGDAFVGAVAWDFALLSWYYGRKQTELVAADYPDGETELRRGDLLAVAVGLYKLAKNPGAEAVLPRLRRCLEMARSS